MPKISALNELRRTALDMVQEFAITQIRRNLQENRKIKVHNREIVLNNMRKINTATVSNHNTKISLLLNKLNTSYDYSKLDNIDNIYIPLKYFINRKYSNILQILSQKSEIYVYLPTIIKGNYKNLLYAHIENSVQKYDIKGFVISNICNIKLLNDLFTDLDKYFKIIANYTFNVFNSQTVLELKKLGVSQFTISPELDKKTITNLCNYGYLQKELIVYGKIPVLNMNYCLLRSN